MFPIRKGKDTYKQKVTVKATNVIGTSETTSEVVDVMEEAEIGEVKNVALKKINLRFQRFNQ